jgi:hypothetical protein
MQEAAAVSGGVVLRQVNQALITGVLSIPSNWWPGIHILKEWGFL